MLDGRENWITLNSVIKDRPFRMLFRKTFYVGEAPEKARIMVSADSRYKLYVNGALAEAGPCKGDREVWYYDTPDLAPLLQKGINVLAAEVLCYPQEHGKGCFSIFRTGHPGLFVQGKIETGGETVDLSADESWKGCIDDGFTIVSESDFFAPMQILERRKAKPELIFWTRADYDDSFWVHAVFDRTFSAEYSPGNLNERVIPYLYRKKKIFKRFRRITSGEAEKNFDDAFHGTQPVTVPGGHRLTVEIDAGEEETGYLHLLLAGGKGSRVRILTSEAYAQEKTFDKYTFAVKKDRLDCANGKLVGFADVYEPAGNGTLDLPEEYEPFWFRTFRFIRLEVETEEEPLTLIDFYYMETGYPLEVKTAATADDPDFEAIWDISERSLRRCMHETYEDCPFYEQLQYVMDSRAQILYTYTVSGDDRLARRCMDDFRRSQRYDGLTNSSHPNYESNVIPGYSIYYILMVYDHMMYFGDKDLLREHLPHIDRVLDFFRSHRTKDGYVDKIGGLNGKDRFWSFVDWAPQWSRTSGVPPATLQGPITMESLLYIYGLQAASKIAAYLGYHDLAAEYGREADALQCAVRLHMTGEDGMLTDGPGVEAYSQHTQVFGILTGTLDTATGKKALLWTMEDKEACPQCSIAMVFYLFRALEATGLYEYSREYWGIWRRMLTKHSTTCIEDEIMERSDCHGWGALILYELPSVILGVRPETPGYETISIRPQPGYLHEAEGTVATPKGTVYVHWSRQEDGELQLTYKAPDNINIVVEKTFL